MTEQFERTETGNKFGARFLRSACVTCGEQVAKVVIGRHYTTGYDAPVLTPAEALDWLELYERLHCTGVTYTQYMGLREDLSDMSDEEFVDVTRRLNACIIP